MVLTYQFTPIPQLRQKLIKCKELELDQDGVDQVQRHVVYCAVYILSRVVLNTPASCLSHAIGSEKKILPYMRSSQMKCLQYI